MDWNLKIGAEKKTLADWGLSEVSLRFTSLDADTLQALRAGAAADAPPLCNYGEAVQLLRGDAAVFSGRRILVPGEGQAAAENQSYTFLGPWDWLARNLYKAQWTGGLGGVLQTIWTSHIIQTGSITQIITAVINYAIARGAPIQLGTVDIPTTPPITEYVDKTCATVIKDALQYAPDAVAWFDYAATPPRFHCRQRSQLTPVTVGLPEAGPQSTPSISGLRVTPRPDLQVPSVEVTCEITSQIDGQERFSFYRENYPPGSNGQEDGCLSTTINLQGFSFTHIKGYIEAVAINVNSLDWWRSVNEALNDPRIDPASLSLVNASRIGADGSPSLHLPRMIVDGEAAEWMQNPDGSALQWQFETIIGTFNFDLYEDAQRTVLVQRSTGMRIPVQVRSTNAPAGATDYSTLEQAEEGDPVPVGLAQYLYQALAPLHHDVSLTIEEQEISGQVLPRHLLNIARGSAAWAAMNAVVQQVLWRLDEGVTEITAGPPRQLSISDLLALLKANRVRRRWTNPSTQLTGDLSGPGNVELARAGANHNTIPGASIESYYAVSSGGNRISLDAAAAKILLVGGAGGAIDINLGDAAGKDIRIREVDVCVNNVTKKMRVLGSAPY